MRLELPKYISNAEQFATIAKPQTEPIEIPSELYENYKNNNPFTTGIFILKNYFNS